MKLQKDQIGLGVVEVLLVFVIVGLIGFTTWYIWHANNNVDKSLTSTNIENNKQTNKKTSNDVISYSGTVQADNCAHQSQSSTTGTPPIGDTGCSITVNKLTIAIVHGNAYFPMWGQIIGFKYTQDITGKRVDIKAHKSGSNYSISSSSDYVKLVN